MTAIPAIKKLTHIASDSLAKLDEQWQQLRKIFDFNPIEQIIPQKNLCVSIEEDGICVAYGSKSIGGFRIRGVRKYSPDKGHLQPEDLVSSLNLAVNEFKIAKTEVTLVVPKSWAVVRTADMPLTVKENLTEVLGYELDRLTPLSSDDAFYDFRLLGEHDGKLALLVLAVRSDRIKPYLEALGKNGFNVRKVTVDMSVLGYLCNHAKKYADTVFLEINENGYEGGLFAGPLLTGSFNARFSADDVKSRVAGIMSDIDPRITSLKKQGKAPQVVVCSRDSNSALLEALKLRVSFCLLNEGDLNFLSPAEKDISYKAVGGVLESLWPSANGLDLLSKGLRQKLKKPRGLTMALVSAIAAVLVFGMVAPYRMEVKRLEEIDRQVKLRKEDARKVEALKKEMEDLGNEISAIENFKKGRQMSVDIIKQLTAVLPKNVWLTRVRAVEAGVELEGYAASATEMLPKLEASKYFKKAEFASPTVRDARLNADRFSLKMEISGNEKPEVKSSKNDKGPKDESKGLKKDEKK